VTTATEFDFHTVRFNADGTPLGTKLVRLDNGRTLALDDEGIYDVADANLDTGECKPNMGWLTWDEILAALDKERAEGGN
jgi:hypothetical protein